MKFLLICFISLIPATTFSQDRITGVPVDARSQSSLDMVFSNYSLFRIDPVEVSNIASSARSGRFDVQFDFSGTASFDLSLAEISIMSEEYRSMAGTSSGTIIEPKPDIRTFRGINNAGGKTSLTFFNGSVYGLLNDGSKQYFIEPLNYLLPGASSDIFVLYETDDVIPNAALTCGVVEMAEQQPPVIPDNAGLTCVQVQLAIASDFSMFTKYGSSAAVQAHNVGVMNNVLWDYVNAQFNNNVEFTIVGQYVSTALASDPSSPLYTGTHASTILANFRTWGNAGNFGLTYDVAQMWTNRDIDGDGAGGNNGVIGLAYVGVVCGASRYHILEDFAGTIPGGSGFALRVLTSHEIGHNFSASHDAAGSPYIMAPSVQNTNIWSAASIASVDGHVGSVGCLAACSTAGAPIADFISTPEGACAGNSIQFIDHTLHGPTSWSWTFPSGSPSSSSIRNPLVSFASPGIYGISLNATNAAGSDTYFRPILISSAPTAACANTGSGTTNSGVIAFNLENINSSSGGTAADGNKYIDRSCSQSTRLEANTTYTASATVGTTNPSNQFNLVQLFIDYNNDGDFADANEAVYSSPSCYIGTHNFSFTTPAFPPVTNQFLRIRLIAKDCVGGVNSCYNVTNGQIEDYSVFFASGSLVPVQMISFTGRQNGSDNLLSWITASEVNHDNFQLERSVNGTDFITIATINGTGSSGLGASYEYTDRVGATSQKYWYRLRIVDLSGRFTFSNIVFLDKENQELVIYPNPVKSGEALQVSGTGITKGELFDLPGRLIKAIEINPANQNFTFPVPATLGAGTYLLRFKKGEQFITRKIIISNR